MTSGERDIRRNLQLTRDRYLSGGCPLKDVIECVAEYSVYLDGEMTACDSEMLCSFLSDELSLRDKEYSTLIVEIRLLYDDLIDCGNYVYRVAELTRTLIGVFVGTNGHSEATLICMLIIDAIIDLNNEHDAFLAMQELSCLASGDAREFLPYGMYRLHKKSSSNIIKTRCLRRLLDFLGEDGGVNKESELYLSLMNISNDNT